MCLRGCDQLVLQTAASALPVERWGEDLFNFPTLRKRFFLRANVHLQICGRAQSKEFPTRRLCKRELSFIPLIRWCFLFFFSCNRALAEANFSLFSFSSLFLLSRWSLVHPRKVMVGGQHRISLIVPQAGGHGPEHGTVKLFWDLTTVVCLTFHFHISLVNMCSCEVFPACSSDAVFLMPLIPFPHPSCPTLISY